MVKFVVREVVRVGERVVILRLETEKPFSFKPGQFLQILLEREGKLVRKAYSIASSSEGGRVIELSVRIVEGGFASNYLANLKAGAVLNVEGPLGHFTLKDEIGNGVVFVATGVGCAALKLMIEEFLSKNAEQEVWFLFGVRTESEILYLKDFEAVASSNKNFHFVPVLSRSDNPRYEHGYVQDAFRRLIETKNQDVYICGLPEMVDGIRVLCKELGYPDGKVHFEKYV